jgi:hypothetical protein
MTAGVYPAGVGPAGIAPVTTTTSVQVERPSAMRYEGSVSDWMLYDATGGYQAVTPVEQGVILSLCVRRGQLKSSPTTGNTIHEIEYLGGENLEADVRDRVLTSVPLKSFIADGSASVDKIVVQEHDNRLLAQVFFRDLTRDPNRILRRNVALS